MPNATTADVEKQRERIREADQITEETREALLDASKVMGRHKSTWGHNRHESVLKRLIMMAWGGTKYDPPEPSLVDALEDKEATGEIVEWIHARYENEETNRDMRGALRALGKVLTNEDPSHKDATPPPSIDWVPATLPSNYDPVPNPANMITWPETREMCEHPETPARDAALLAVAWDAGPRSGELEELTVGDVSDHDLGKIIRVDGKTGQRDVTITNAVPYVRQWLNNHPAPEDPGAPLWSKLKRPEGISYRMYRKIFIKAAERVGLEKPNDPTNFRKSSASALASKGVSQAHLEKRYGWKRGSDAASRYIRVFGEDADRELAQARGMDVEFEEPDPEGPTDCKRCGVLIDHDADKCDNCGFIQDRELAQETVPTSGPDLGSMIREAVKEEVGEILGTAKADVREGIGEGADNPDMTRARAEVLTALEENPEVLDTIGEAVDVAPGTEAGD